MQPIAQPLGGGRDLRRDMRHVSGRLTDHHDPSWRAELLRQWSEVGQRQSDRRRLGCHRPREAKTKARRQSATFAVLVGETKGFSRSGDVEQQRMRHDDEEDVDELGARDHGPRASASQYVGLSAAAPVHTPMSETDSQLLPQGPLPRPSSQFVRPDSRVVTPQKRRPEPPLVHEPALSESD